MFFITVAAIEMVGSQVSVIGNALKKYKVVGHNAFNWMNPNPNFTNNKWLGSVEKITNRISGLMNGLFAIDMIAQVVLTEKQTEKQLSDDKKEIIENVQGLYKDYQTGLGYPENKATATAAGKSEKDSKGTAPTQEEVANLQN